MDRERLVDEVLMLMPTLMRAIGGPDPAEMAELASRGVPTEVRISPGHLQNLQQPGHTRHRRPRHLDLPYVARRARRLLAAQGPPQGEG